jgi:N-acetylglutamate synthase
VTGMSRGQRTAGRAAAGCRLEVRLSAADLGRRVVIRWRRPAAGGGDEVADVLGVLEAAGAASFAVREASGEMVAMPRDRALPGKTVPAAPSAAKARQGMTPPRYRACQPAWVSRPAQELTRYIINTRSAV